MTDLYTASYRAYQPCMGLGVVTSLGLPRWRPEAKSWPRCWLLTPTPTLFRLDDWADFQRDYTARLDSFGPKRIARTLERIARDHQADRIVLLCHEVDGRECHRGLIATYLLATTGEVVTEVTREGRP